MGKDREQLWNFSVGYLSGGIFTGLFGLFSCKLKAKLNNYFATSCPVPGWCSCTRCPPGVVNISRAADCPGLCPATGAGRPPGWNPARSDARAGTSLPIISGRAMSRRHDAPAARAGPSCLRDVERSDKRPGRLLLLRGEALRDSSGAGRRGRLLDGIYSCLCGVRRRFLQSSRPAVLRHCS